MLTYLNYLRYVAFSNLLWCMRFALTYVDINLLHQINLLIIESLCFQEYIFSWTLTDSNWSSVLVQSGTSWVEDPGSIPIYEWEFFADFVRNEIKLIMSDEWPSPQLTLILTYFTKLTYLASLRYVETWPWQLTYVDVNSLTSLNIR